MTDLLSGSRCLDVAQVQIEPIAAGPAAFGSQYVHLIAILQFVVQSDHFAIDLGPPAAVADLGVDMIGEVYGGGTRRQVHYVAFGGESVDTIPLEDIAFERINELPGIGHLLPPLHQRAQPGNLGLKGDIALRLLFVAPVRGYAELGSTVHLAGAELHLQGLALRPHDSGMERLVHVILRRGYEVVELAGNGTPQAVHNAQHGIAIPDSINDHAYAPHIVDLFEGQALAFHLGIDRVNVFGPS